ncbi:hypothetical protein RJ639_032472, partial [Escallonia herrerae]
IFTKAITQMGRSPCCSKIGLNRGAWTAAEDKTLTDYIKLHGEGRWRNLPKRAGNGFLGVGLKRCGKSCRLRWLNYLRPDIKRGNISLDEEELIIRLHKLLGNRWSLIAGRLPGRTDNEIKNYWNTTLRKRVNDRKNSTSTCKQSRSNHSTKKDPKKTEPHHKNESNAVVRTKARRCSRAYFNPQQHKTEPMERIPRPGTVLTKDSSISNPVELNDPSSFMMDANMGQFCLTEVLMNFEFSDIFDTNNKSDLSPSSKVPIIFPDDMLESWTE